MGQNTQWTPEEEAANQKKVNEALSKAYYSGDLTDEQAASIRAAGIVSPDVNLPDGTTMAGGTGWGAPAPLAGVDTSPVGKITQEEVDLWSTLGQPGVGGGGLSLGGAPDVEPYTGPPIGIDADDLDGGAPPIGGGGYEPTGPTYEGGNDTGLEFGGGVGVEGQHPLAGGAGILDTDLFRASDNAGFYNTQLGGLMGQQLRNSMREERARENAQAASEERANAPSFQADWSWANDGKGLRDRQPITQRPEVDPSQPFGPMGAIGYVSPGGAAFTTESGAVTQAQPLPANTSQWSRDPATGGWLLNGKPYDYSLNDINSERPPGGYDGGSDKNISKN